MSNSTQNKTRRRNLIIYPRFQVPLLWINLGVVSSVSLLIWLQMRNVFADLAPVAGLSGYPTETYLRYLEHHSSVYQTSLLICVGAGIAVSAIATLMLSHRFAGPIIRMRNYFGSLAEGKDPGRELEFRDGDFLSDIPPLVNQAIKISRGRAERDKNRAA